ncbi:ABC transporter permease [bacterium AH-315-J23]|nr:ABC transporter permease [bacterium AH-315-J23]
MIRPGEASTIDTSRGAPAFGKFERKIAARYLGAKKKDGGVGLIAVLSFACIMLAIFAMITIMSIMNGFRSQMIDMTIGLDGHMYVGSASANPTPLEIIGLRDRVSKIDGVENAFIFSQTQTFVQAGNQTAPALVTGISAEDLSQIDLINKKIVMGSLDGFGTGYNGGDKVVIGVYLANRLGVIAGDRITIYSPVLKVTPFGSRPVFKSYEVAAVFASGLYTADNLNIYMPIIQASLFFDQGRSPTDIQLRLDNADLIHEMKNKIRDVAGEPVFIETWEDKNQTTATALRTEQISMRFIFAIVVLIAIFPILSAMIMLVKNKSKDIAILKTIGATSSSILRIFLMAGAAIGILGTIAGVILGIIFCLNIEYIQAAIEAVTGTELFPADVYGIDHIPVKILTSEVVTVAFWGFLVATLATYFPALTASKTDPVEALRYE